MKKLSCQNQEKNMDISSTVYKWKPSKTVLDIFFVGFWFERTTDSMDFSQKQQFKIINVLMDLFLINTAFFFIRC